MPRPKLSNCERVVFTASQYWILSDWLKQREVAAMTMHGLAFMVTGVPLHSPDEWLAYIDELLALLKKGSLTRDALCPQQGLLLERAFAKSNPLAHDGYRRSAIRLSRVYASIYATARKLAKLGIVVDPAPLCDQIRGRLSLDRPGWLDAPQAHPPEAARPSAADPSPPG